MPTFEMHERHSAPLRGARANYSPRSFIHGPHVATRRSGVRDLPGIRVSIVKTLAGTRSRRAVVRGGRRAGGGKVKLPSSGPDRSSGDLMPRLPSA